MCHGLALDAGGGGGLAPGPYRCPAVAEVVPYAPRTGYTVLLDYAHTPDGFGEHPGNGREGLCHAAASLRCSAAAETGIPSKRPADGTGCRQSGSDLLRGDQLTTPAHRGPRWPSSERSCPGVEETGCPHAVVENRGEAIRHAMICAKQDDVILLAGKGHEPYQEIGHVRHPFDEKIVVAELLAELRS